MNWTEIKIIINSKDTDAAADIANMVVPYGIYIEDYTDLEEMAMKIAHINLIDEDLIAKDKTKSIIHIYIDEQDNPLEAVQYLMERYKAANIENELLTERVTDDGWRDNWKKYFKPIEIGNRLAVCPTWESYENKDMRKVISIDPGAAFGTGTHDTTRLCLALIDEYANGGSLLDIGTGSGILAISGLLLGCNKCVGVDIDPLAVKTAKENAEQNRVWDRCEFLCGDLTERVSGKFDLICANIVADVIIPLCKTVGEFMNPEGKFICSGIIDTRKDEVESALIANGFTIKNTLESGGWVAFAAVRS